MAEDPNLVAIKARLQVALDAIRRGEREVDVGQFVSAQLGLSVPVVDAWGRLWQFRGSTLVMVYSPPPHGCDGFIRPELEEIHRDIGAT